MLNTRSKKVNFVAYSSTVFELLATYLVLQVTRCTLHNDTYVALPQREN